MSSDQSNDDRDPFERVKASGCELALYFDGRVGASPFARYVDGEWDLISLTYIPTPEYGRDDPDAEHGVNTEVHTVDLEPEPRPESELREIARQPRHINDDADSYAGVTVVSLQEAPFPDRDEIPAKEDIVRQIECPHCETRFRQYLPEPFEQCPHCDGTIEDIDRQSDGGEQ